MIWVTRFGIIPLIVLSWVTVRGYAAEVPSLSPEIVADFIHAVVESHRAFYTAHVVEPLEEQGVVEAGAEWASQKKTIPLPVQVVNETSNMFSTKATGLRYRLISLWPINPKNGPRDELDKNSLNAVRERPEKAITRIIKINNQPYLHAIYADIAVTHTCIDCHNSHPKSPKKDFQIGDVMGGLLIEFPIKKE